MQGEWWMMHGDGEYGFANHLFSINCPDVVHLLQASAVCGRKSLQKLTLWCKYVSKIMLNMMVFADITLQFKFFLSLNSFFSVFFPDDMFLFVDDKYPLIELTNSFWFQALVVSILPRDELLQIMKMSLNVKSLTIQQASGLCLRSTLYF